MKHKILSMTGALLLMLIFSSCHEQNDTLMSYDYQDDLAFNKAEKSFAGKFEVLWKAMNQNYSLWDYEKENGLDWDAVYDEYHPQFEALDQQENVTDKELKELVEKVIGPLHDGHMYVGVKNHLTGNYVSVSPSIIRNSTRPDFSVSQEHLPEISYYVKKENGEVELDKDGNPYHMEYSTKLPSLLDQVRQTKGIGLQWIASHLKDLMALTTPTAEQVETLQTLNSLYDQLASIIPSVQGIEEYNLLTERYSFLNVPGLTPINLNFDNYGITIKYALLKGNIAYLYFSDFNLTAYLYENNESFFPNADNSTLEHIQNVREVWVRWFMTIQELHKSGQLGGVIIDVRGNGGGIVNDYNYVLGALLPSGGFTYGNVRYKRGTGRLDYSPLMPATISTLETDHAVITEPIAVLANCGSVSMAEVTSLSAKEISNARLIGKQTWGGLCLLTDNSQNSYNYSGHIGIVRKSPVFVYLPSLATFTLDGQQLEGIGISPDIEVDLDEDLLTATGQDTQLDRALQYIRTGK